MAAVEKFVLDNPFRTAPVKEEPPCYQAPPGPCSLGNSRFHIPAQPHRAMGAEVRGQHRGAQQQLQRGAKRQFPGESDFYCDACEQSFAGQAELSSHLAGHVACPRDGCTFAANPALVALHEKLQHDNPLIRRSAAVGTVDDVEEWRRQRRLRYPTLRNIEAKKAAEAERQARREVIRDDNRRRPRRNNKRRQRAQRRRASPHERPTPPQQTQPPPQPSAVEEPPPCEEAPADRQTPSEPDQITDSESDGESRATKAAPQSPPLVSGALASLMACYNSGSDDEAPKEDPKPKTPVTPAAPDTDVPPPKRAAVKTTQAGTSAPARAAAPHPRAPQTYRPPQRRLTLLERLLAPQVRHERNLILQCVHYVVDNDFFGQASPKDDAGCCSST
ncbi:hypothetical protein V5799_012847 [Amblyomma americanum]|uniref:C2H2-type domain-containing protein n=1 Tax=Amblyomma americanum TaxID=6943 RepID=A0AAQ4E7P6_AMBAM